MRHELVCHIYDGSKGVCYVLFFWGKGIVTQRGTRLKNFLASSKLAPKTGFELSSTKAGWE